MFSFVNSDLFREVEDIITFIKKHLKVEYIITGAPQRTELYKIYYLEITPQNPATN